jgi:signal transduction histidine kinase
MFTSDQINSQESQRIAALKRYEILDTPPDAKFDRLTRFASKLFNVPIVLISLVDTERVWFKSKYGVDVNQVKRHPGFCATTILKDEVHIIQDALIDETTASDPLVTGDFGLRFYAGAPLKNKEGYNLGSFCLMDNQPGTFSTEQKELLTELAGVVIDHIEMRLKARIANAQQNQLLQIAAHDLKNPLTTIPVRADLIKLKKHDPDMVDKMCDQIKQAGLKMTRTIDELLTTSSMESGKINLYTFKLDFGDIVTQIVESNQALADHKKQNIELKIEKDSQLYADEQRLTEIVDNLISNAIKYSPFGAEIEVKVYNLDKKAVLAVKDNGPGLTDEDKLELFQRFARLSAKPTGGENSSGLGLSIVKQLVEAHQGKVWAESKGKNQGSTFYVELPAIN